MKFIKKIGFLLPMVCLTVILSGCRNTGSDAAIPKEDASENMDNTDIADSEILAYITDLDAEKISIDVVEWVTVPSSRADELGIKEDDGPSGFYIYNPDTLTEQFTLPTDCKITVLDWQNSYEPQTISAEKFVAILQERGEQNNFIPYTFKITNGAIIEISEHYVP